VISVAIMVSVMIAITVVVPITVVIPVLPICYRWRRKRGHRTE
jgi:hypothetical protein